MEFAVCFLCAMRFSPSLKEALIPCQIFDAPVVGRLRLFGKEASGNALVVVAVVRHAGAALPMARAVISTRTGPFVVTSIHT